MDRIYRPQRWVYDPLRWFFLIGRDLLLERLEAAPGDRVLEIGCGTARNLIELHRRRPGVRLYGLDASTAMLKTARAKLRRRAGDGFVPAALILLRVAFSADSRAVFSGDKAPWEFVSLKDSARITSVLTRGKQIHGGRA